MNAFIVNVFIMNAFISTARGFAARPHPDNQNACAAGDLAQVPQNVSLTRCSGWGGSARWAKAG